MVAADCFLYITHASRSLLDNDLDLIRFVYENHSHKPVIWVLAAIDAAAQQDHRTIPAWRAALDQNNAYLRDNFTIDGQPDTDFIGRGFVAVSPAYEAVAVSPAYEAKAARAAEQGDAAQAQLLDVARQEWIDALDSETKQIQQRFMMAATVRGMNLIDSLRDILEQHRNSLDDAMARAQQRLAHPDTQDRQELVDQLLAVVHEGKSLTATLDELATA